MRNGVPGSAFAVQAARLRPGLAMRCLAACLGFALHWALWLWTADALQLLPDLHAPLGQVLAGLSAALFRAFVITLPLGLGLGLVSWLTALHWRMLRLPPLRERFGAYLRAGSPEEQAARSGRLLALGPVALGWFGGSVRIAEVWITSMVRPAYAALACVTSSALLLLMAAVSFPAVALLGTWLVLLLRRIPVLGPRAFGSALHLLGWLVVGLAGGSAFWLYRFREPLSFLPWAQIAQVLVAAVLALGSWLLFARLPGRTRRPRALFGAALVLGSLIIAYLQSPVGIVARQISERQSLAGRLGQTALLWAWDRDRDGYLPGFGGGDCAPGDRTRNPGALEVPGNGIDEDCDDKDLDPRATAQRGKYDYGLPAAVPGRPPIVLITVDAFAAKHMHALGYARQLTPHVDAFAARSVFFRQCYAQGPSTRLSFPSIFTSRWDTQIVQELVGHHPFPIDAHERLLAEVMQEAGYDTAAVLSDPYFSPRYWRGITRGFAHLVESPFTTEPTLPHDGPRVTQAAIEELERPRSQPLFLWVHYYDAHSPHQQPADMPAFGARRQDVYDAELALVDREVGKLLEVIERTFGGQALVVLSADHGIAFDEPRHATFNYGYDLHTAVLHVPLIVHAPFLQPRALDGVVSTMDIAPTLANLLRLPGRLPYEGMSLVPELFSGKISRPPELMHQMFIEERKWKHEEPLERVGLRTERFNLLEDRKTGFIELYDYREDYYETHDLALDPLYGATLATLRKQLSSLLYSARGEEQTAVTQKAAP
jgi:arylsulfatase A-like enzyme